MASKETVSVHEGGTLVVAKVPEASTVDEMEKALEETGRRHYPSFRLTHGPIGSLNSGVVATIPIPESLRDEEDLGHCLVMGIGEVLPK